MAGRIQLTTKGVQDIYFTEEPDYSHFVQLFKRHTNYTTQFVNIDIDGKAEFGKTVRVTIPKDQGDMIKTLSLDVELNPFEDADTTRIGYVESIGHAMIEYVDMYIGDEKIQHIPSDYLQIYSEHAYTQTKQKALEKLIGKYPDRTSDVPVGSGVILGHLGPATTRRKLFIDIPFYFYQRPELAVPLCAMCYQEVTIEIKFRDIRDCVVKTDPPVDDTVQTVTLDYEVESSEILTSNIMVVSNDGLSFASNVNNSIEITGKTTFAGDGIVSPAMNIIVNSSGIYRYEDDQWVQKSTDSVSGEVQFSDDGNVIAQIGLGLWEWDGTGYVFRSVPTIAAISRDGSSYATTVTGNINDTFNVYTRTTNAQVGDTIVFSTSTTTRVKLNYDGMKLLIATSSGPTVNIFELFENEWVVYGQVINPFELDEIHMNKSGTALFLYNVNEIYGTTSTGVGRVYIYDTTTSLWVEVYRYRGENGTYISMNDGNTIISVKRTPTQTDYIAIQAITRSVENYDDIIIRSIENIVNTGSNVYGVGYQALTTATRDSFLVTTNTTYSVNATQQIPTLNISSLRISDNGLVLLAVTQFTVVVYTRGRLIRLFNFNPKLSTGQNIAFGSETFDKTYISKTGTYFAVVTDVNTRVYRVVSNTLIEFVLTTGETASLLSFSDDETQVITIGDAVKIYSLSSPSDPPTELTSTYAYPVMAVSKDLNRFAKYDSVNGEVKLFNSDGTQSGLKVNLSSVLAVRFSKDGNLVAIVTATYTYIYSFDGNGWNLKSSFYASIEPSLFYDVKITDDGNVISYVDGDAVADKSVIRSYVYNGIEWKRVFKETDLAMNDTGVVADISEDTVYYAYITGAPENNIIKVKAMNTQQETITVNVDQEFSILYPDQIRSCKLCMEVVFLDEYEREVVKRSSRDYVITQLQRSVYTLPKGIETHKVRTNFINPVKELFFLIRRVNNKQYDDFVSPFDYDNDALTSENKLVFYENLKSLELTLNDTQVLDKDTGNFVFLKAIQPAIHHSKTPLIRRFYSYSFACEPEQYYPTGQVNFSLINNQLITVNLTENTTIDRTMDVYALSYNVLRVHKGMVRMLFNAT